MNLAIKCFIGLALLACSITAKAQRNRYNFAQTYFGIQGDILHGQSSSPDFGAARLVVGGTHFWYHADFYISFPVSTFALSSSAWQYSEGVTTGGRYLPFGPGSKVPHPFVGISWMTPSLRVGQGPQIQQNRLGIDGGLSLVLRKRYTLEARVQYQHNANVNYPDSRESFALQTPPVWSFGIAFKKYFDTTAGNASPAGQAWLLAAEQHLEQHGGLSAWSIALGLTANIVGQSYRTDGAGFLPSQPPIALGPDIGIGYYFHRADVGVRLAYRTFSSTQEAYGYAWHLREHRLSFEGFKFLFDYKGFVPFLGISLSANHQNFETRDRGALSASGAGWMPVAGAVFGWDIRPSKTDWFILRSNLRYHLSAGITGDQYDLRSTQIEINFIQLVIYPQRFSKLKSLNL
jgi:hypothetical protein